METPFCGVSGGVRSLSDEERWLLVSTGGGGWIIGNGGGFLVGGLCGAVLTGTSLLTSLTAEDEVASSEGTGADGLDAVGIMIVISSLISLRRIPSKLSLSVWVVEDVCCTSTP